MARKRKGLPIHGWVNLDKPYDLGSTPALAKVRRAYNAQKAGHAGTLDPLATGILPVALGEATKTIQFMQDHFKTYEFEVTWGESRTTDDLEGEVVHTSDTRPALNDIAGLLPQHIGIIQQTPPQFSAIKIDGQRAYDLARSGETVEIQSREVEIESFQILDHAGDTTRFEVICGKGTYIRALARDMGKELGCYGYISALRRTQVGPFKADNAISLDKLLEISDSAAADTDLLDQYLLPIDSALDDILALNITQDEAIKLRHGQALSFISKADFHRLEALEITKDETETALALCDDVPVGIVEIKMPHVKSVKIFNL
jgi:tRNA pseudouridine55 synthase